jgi:hypothetical protein
MKLSDDVDTLKRKGRAFSMTRLDQLAKPHRRNGEHIFAILERERRQATDLENLSKLSLSQGSPAIQDKRKSRSMSQLNGRVKSRDNSRNSRNRLASPLQRIAKNAETTKSMTQLSGSSIRKSASASATPVKSGWDQKHTLSLHIKTSGKQTSF